MWEADRQSESLAVFADILAKPEVVKDKLVPGLLVDIGERYLQLNNLAAAANCFSLLSQSENIEYRMAGTLGKGPRIACKK